MNSSIRFCCLAFALFAHTFEVGSETYKEHLKHVLNSTYDANERPHYAENRPVKIRMHMDIMDMGTSKGVFHLELYLKQIWDDPRINFSTNIGVVNIPKHIREVWVPDTIFRNAKEAMSHSVTVPNMYLRAHPNGTIEYSRKYSVYLHCMMDLRRFPMDTQVCSIDVSLYGSLKDAIRLEWKHSHLASLKRGCSHGEVQINANNMEAGEFLVRSVQCSNCTADARIGGDDKFDCLTAIFVLDRMTGFYIINAYLPYTLIVVMSWSSFWINLECTAARVSVAFLTLLAVHTKGVGLHRTALPNISYVMALDVYMFICLCFVMVALLEYIVAINMSAAETRIVRSESCNAGGRYDTHRVSVATGCLRCRLVEKAMGTSSGESLDKLFRILYPLTFTVVAAAYWIYYMHLS